MSRASGKKRDHSRNRTTDAFIVANQVAAMAGEPRRSGSVGREMLTQNAAVGQKNEKGRGRESERTTKKETERERDRQTDREREREGERGRDSRCGLFGLRFIRSSCFFCFMLKNTDNFYARHILNSLQFNIQFGFDDIKIFRSLAIYIYRISRTENEMRYYCNSFCTRLYWINVAEWMKCLTDPSTTLI